MRRRISKLEVNIFPFLSVLFSIIGVLMLLMLIILATRVTVAYTRAVPAHVAPLSGDEDLSEEAYQRLEQVVKELSASLERQLAELRRVRSQRDKIRQLLAVHRDEVELASGDGLHYGFDISALQKVTMIPARNQPVVKRPRFIEVDYEGYVLHPEASRYSSNELPAEVREIDPSYRPSSRLELLLESEAFAKRDSQYLLFLIRPSGSSSFDRMKSYLVRKYPLSAEISQIDIGWEPFAPEWLLFAPPAR
jgi:hypothetical protein